MKQADDLRCFLNAAGALLYLVAHGRRRAGRGTQCFALLRRAPRRSERSFTIRRGEVPASSGRTAPARPPPCRFSPAISRRRGGRVVIAGHDLLEDRARGQGRHRSSARATAAKPRAHGGRIPRLLRAR